MLSLPLQIYFRLLIRSIAVLFYESFYGFYFDWRFFIGRLLIKIREKTSAWQKCLEYFWIWKTVLCSRLRIKENLLMVCFLLFFMWFKTISKAPMHWQPDSEWKHNPNDKEFFIQKYWYETSMNGPWTIFRNALFIGPISINYHLGIDIFVFHVKRDVWKKMNNCLLFGWSVTLTMAIEILWFSFFCRFDESGVDEYECVKTQQIKGFH